MLFSFVVRILSIWSVIILSYSVVISISVMAQGLVLNIRREEIIKSSKGIREEMLKKLKASQSYARSGSGILLSSF